MFLEFHSATYFVVCRIKLGATHLLGVESDHLPYTKLCRSGGSRVNKAISNPTCTLRSIKHHSIIAIFCKYFVTVVQVVPKSCFWMEMERNFQMQKGQALTSGYVNILSQSICVNCICTSNLTLCCPDLQQF